MDLDNTIIKGQSQKYLLKYLREKNRISLLMLIRLYFWFFLYKIGYVKDPKEAMSYAYEAMISSMSVNEVKSLMDDFCERVLLEKTRPDMRERIEKHIDNGDLVILVTNAFYALAESFGKKIGIKNIIATELEVVGGKYTGEIKGDINYGGHKAEKAKDFLSARGLGLEGSFSYADHYSDMSILKMADKPIAVCPDKRLRKECKKRGWGIIN